MTVWVVVAPLGDAGDAHLVPAFAGTRATHSSADPTTSVQKKRGISLGESSFLTSHSTPRRVYVSPSTTRRPSIIRSPFMGKPILRLVAVIVDTTEHQ